MPTSLYNLHRIMKLSAKLRQSKPADWKVKKLKRLNELDTNSNKKNKGGDISDDSDLSYADSKKLNGLVIERHGSNLLVEVDSEEDPKQKELMVCLQKTSLISMKVVAGDRVSVVKFEQDADQKGLVIALHERNNLLTRPSATSNENKLLLKPIASNIDQIIIVIAAAPDVPPPTIDRYIVAAIANEISEIVLLINKCDLDGTGKLYEELNYYERLGYPMVLVSASTGVGMDKLKRLLANKTSIFVGQSGVGKSSLINTILPEVNAKVGDLVKKESIGSHTTSNARLYHLNFGQDRSHLVPLIESNSESDSIRVERSDGNVNQSSNYNDGMLIDSPGIRELGIWHLTEEAITNGFKEIKEYSKKCKFRNCKHSEGEEPHCAVRNAIYDGVIHPNRYFSYQQILLN